MLIYIDGRYVECLKEAKIIYDPLHVWPKGVEQNLVSLTITATPTEIKQEVYKSNCELIAETSQTPIAVAESLLVKL